MVRYFDAVWRCRYFWLMLVRMDLRTRYRRSVLGLGWSLLHPIAMTVVICTMFSTIMQMDWRDYGPFLLAGLACWNYLTFTTTMGCQCLLMGESYIRQHPAPLAIYPLRTALGGLVHFLLALCVVIPTAWFLNAQGLEDPLSLLTLIPAIVLYFVLGWSLAVLAGFSNVYFQDTQHLTEVVFQILFYATPIIYRPSMLRANNLEWLAQCNPLLAFLEIIRQPILYGRVPDLETFGIAALTCLVTFTAASITLARLQRRLIFQL